MKFKARKLGISVGDSLVCLLNSNDAAEMEIQNSDRVSITRGKNTVTAVVDIANTHHFVNPGEVGLMDEVAEKLGIKSIVPVDISHIDKPLSLHYIKKKLSGEKLTEQEIFEIVHDIVQGKLSKIEIAYFVSATYANHMSLDETIYLTKAMINTGEIVKFNRHPIVDKHCIGGVAGNRTTMIVVPIITALGYVMPKSSSRSITSPSGTADTMEVLCPVDLSTKEIQKIVHKVNGCFIWGGGLSIAPADDRIINVEHPLSLDPEAQLLASIMAKKKAISATHLLIDIPYGKGAKVETLLAAKHLKKQFELISRKLNIKVNVILTDGSGPIGFGFGPALEARDVLQVLENDVDAPKDLKEKAIIMAGKLLKMLGEKNPEKTARDVLESGHAHDQMMKIIEAQGGKKISSSEIKLSEFKYEYKSKHSGFISHLDNKKISKLARLCGAPQDKESGIYIALKKHDRIARGDILITFYSNSKQRIKYAKEVFEKIGGIDIT